MIGAWCLVKYAITMVLNVPIQFTEAINAYKQSSMRVSKYFTVNEPIDTVIHKRVIKSMRGNTNWANFLRLLDGPAWSGCILNQIRTFLVVANGSILNWISKFYQKFTLMNKLPFLRFKWDETSSHLHSQKHVEQYALLSVSTVWNDSDDWMSSTQLRHAFYACSNNIFVCAPMANLQSFGGCL